MRRKLTILASTALFAGLAAFATAQSFRLEEVTSRPGQNATVRLYLTSPIPVAAVNFTVRANNAAVSGAITGAKGSAAAIQPATFAYVGNSIGSGPAREYRGVLYATTANTTFAATTEQHIATLTVPIAGNAAAGLQIELDVVNAFDTDGITALLGVSNAAGQSIVNGAPITQGSNARPSATDGRIKVDPVITDTDFKGSTLVPGWVYSQFIPTFIPRILPDGATGANLKLPASVNAQNGVVVSLAANPRNSFSLLQIDSDSQQADFLKASRDTVVFYNWDTQSNQNAGINLPSLRLRTSTRDFSWAQLAVFQEVFEGANAGAVVLPLGTLATPPKRLRAAMFAPASVDNNTSIVVGGQPVNIDGMLTSVDFLTFASGIAGAQFAVSNFNAFSTPVSALTGVQQHYTHNYATNGPDGFALVLNGLVPPANEIPSGASASDYQVVYGTANGISIAPNSNRFTPIPGVGGAFYLAFGSAEKTFTANNPQFPLKSNRLYRFDARLRTTVTNTNNHPTVRLRLTLGQQFPGLVEPAPQPDFSQEIVLAQPAGTFDNSMAIPNAAQGRTYTSFFVVPPECEDGVAKISFDVYPGVDAYEPGAVILQEINVRSYNIPTP